MNFDAFSWVEYPGALYNANNKSEVRNGVLWHPVLDQ
jgi:hypothetical protein